MGNNNHGPPKKELSKLSAGEKLSKQEKKKYEKKQRPRTAGKDWEKRLEEGLLAKVRNDMKKNRDHGPPR